MKKTNFLFLSVILCACLSSCDSCNKSSDSPSYKAVWSLGSQNFNSNTATNSNLLFQATTGESDGITVHYGSMPTATNQTYKIVNFNNTNLASDEITVEVDHGVSDVWLSTGDNNKTAITAMENGELRLGSDLGVSARHFNGSGPQSDTSTISFNVLVK